MVLSVYLQEVVQGGPLIGIIVRRGATELADLLMSCTALARTLLAKPLRSTGLQLSFLYNEPIPTSKGPQFEVVFANQLFLVSGMRCH